MPAAGAQKAGATRPGRDAHERAGAFGKWDWVANGILFGFYHIHQPWVFIGAAIEGVFLFTYPTKRFKSAWFGIIAHSGQSVLLAFLLLGLVLGLA